MLDLITVALLSASCPAPSWRGRGRDPDDEEFVASLDLNNAPVAAGADCTSARALSDLARRALHILTMCPGTHASDIALALDESPMDVVDAITELLEAGLASRGS